jgi:hypothetical protein
LGVRFATTGEADMRNVIVVVAFAFLAGACGGSDVTARCVGMHSKLGERRTLAPVGSDAYYEWLKKCQEELKAGDARDALKKKFPECWERARREVPFDEADSFFDKCAAAAGSR